MGGTETTKGVRTAAEAIDPRTLDTLEERLGKEMAVRLSVLFREQAAARAVAIQAACEACDLEALRRVAHDWIADGAAMGARALADTGRRVEQLAIAGDGRAFLGSVELVHLAKLVSQALSARYGEAA